MSFAPNITLRTGMLTTDKNIAQLDPELIYYVANLPKAQASAQFLSIPVGNLFGILEYLTFPETMGCVALTCSQLFIVICQPTFIKFQSHFVNTKRVLHFAKKPARSHLEKLFLLSGLHKSKQLAALEVKKANTSNEPPEHENPALDEKQPPNPNVEQNEDNEALVTEFLTARVALENKRIQPLRISLKGFTHLRDLDLSSAEICWEERSWAISTMDSFAVFLARECRYLEKLQFPSFNGSLTGEFGLTAFHHMPHLHTLSIPGHDGLDDEAVEGWKMPSLTSLNLSESGLTGQGMVALLKNMPNLQHLSLAKCGAIRKLPIAGLKVKAQGLALVDQLKGPLKLKSLDLWKSVFVQETTLCMLLRRCPELQKVFFGQVYDCTDWVLRALACACPDLEEASLPETRVTQEGLRALLRGCPRIHTLHTSQSYGIVDVPRAFYLDEDQKAIDRKLELERARDKLVMRQEREEEEARKQLEQERAQEEKQDEKEKHHEAGAAPVQAQNSQVLGTVELEKQQSNPGNGSDQATETKQEVEVEVLTPVSSERDPSVLPWDHKFLAKEDEWFDPAGRYVSPDVFTLGQSFVDLSLQDLETVNDLMIRKLAKASPNLVSLHLDGCVNVSSVSLRMLSIHCPKLKTLGLMDCERVQDVGLRFLSKGCPNLEYINLEGCNVSDAGIKMLGNGCPNLISVNLSGCVKITDQAIVHLAMCCRGLEAVYLARCTLLTDLAALALASQPKLEILDFNDCTSLTDAALISLTECKSLRVLNIKNVAALTPDGITQIVLRTNIEEMDLGYHSKIEGKTIWSLMSMYQTYGLPLKILRSGVQH